MLFSCGVDVVAFQCPSCEPQLIHDYWLTCILRLPLTLAVTHTVCLAHWLSRTQNDANGMPHTRDHTLNDCPRSVVFKKNIIIHDFQIFIDM